MGEIMRMRLARGAQRRVPAPPSVVKLDAEEWRLDAPRAKLNALQQSADQNNPTFVEYFGKMSDLSTLRQYLTNAYPNPTVVAALFSLDEWLASTNNRPSSTKAFSDELAATVGPYLNGPEWQQLRKLLAELFYAALIISALNFPGVPILPLVEALGFLTRLLLVVALADTFKSTPALTPEDIYNTLRWRTLVLPDWMVQLLLAIRTAKKAVIVRKPGFADLYITREEWDHYEPAEIASIENIMASELKSRVHVLVNQTQVTATTDITTTSIKEQDSTTTDKTQLQQQSSSNISIAAHVDGQVDTSTSFGPTTVNAHIGGSLDYSNASATSRATTQSHETVSVAISKIEQTTRQVRTVSTLTRATDKEEHKFDNVQGASKAGIYRWVDQIQNVELDRYPHRFLMEFEIPEPGAWTRWLHLNDLARTMINKPPLPLTQDGTLGTRPLKPTDVDANSYLEIAARYSTTGMNPPPPDTIVVALNLSYDSSAGGGGGGSNGGPQGDSSLTVPNGYEASTYSVSTVAVLADGGPFWVIRMIVGAGEIQVLGDNLPIPPPPHSVFRLTDIPVGHISRGTIPIGLEAAVTQSYELNFEVTCERLPEIYEQWQNDTYALIVGAYNAMLQAYNDEKAGLTIQQTNLADANSPVQNAQTIKQELKRLVIEMLIGTPFRGRNAISLDGKSTPPNEPSTDLSNAANFAPEVQFLEQAFEWETLSYICYPYYWADASRWPDLTVIEGNDSNFADFLRAGSARVVLAARPGFEDQVNFYVKFGILWGGGPMPAPGDTDYLSIADEIKAQQQRPLDVAVIDTWQVRLPTTLIWLVNKNPDGQLPSNLNPTIDTTPEIVSLSPASGKVDDSVTIAGRNFGDIKGRSTVTFFNGIEATPTRWSVKSIDVTVPTGAATGNVFVTLNRLASDGVTVKPIQSNGMNFTVN